MLRKNLWLCLGLLACMACSKDDDTVTPAPEEQPPAQEQPPAPTAAAPTDRRGEVSFTVGEAKYVAGYSQVSADNQDAYVFKEVGGRVVWTQYYDRSPDDSKAAAVIADAGRLYVAFTCTGGNTGFKATSGAFQGSYGSGGGAKITYLARLDVSNGNVLAATFIGARLNDNRTNTLYPDNTVTQPLTLLPDGQVRLQAVHAYDKGDGRLTPGNPDAQCNQSGGKWVGTFNERMALVAGDCLGK
jgi:hypothetical protein